MIQSSYLHCVLDHKEFSKRVIRLANKIKKFSIKNRYDAILFTGVSGMAMGFPLSLKLKKPIVIVRKEGCAWNHSEYQIEGLKEFKRYIIVDDRISTGKTINNIIRNIKDHCPNAKLTGIFLYNQYYSGFIINNKFKGIPVISLKPKY